MQPKYRKERWDAPPFIPLAMIAPHENQALRNHSQTLSELASRGGLSPSEAVKVLTDTGWTVAEMGTIDEKVSAQRLHELIEAWGS